MTPGPLTVVGDANVDLVLRGDVVPRFGQAEQLLTSADLVLGGSASIVATGAARLGVPTAVVAAVGTDTFGAVTERALAERGVDTSALRRVDGSPTGISAILTADADRAILTLPGTIPLLTADAVRDGLRRTAPAHVHFASYFLLEPLARELPTLLAELRERGVTTSIDTNWDPRQRWHGLGRVLPLVDVFLPNLEELRAIAAATGGPAAPDEHRYDGADLARAEHVSGHGPVVVVKAGADGGWSVHPSGRIVRAPGLPVAVVDTTGAGDSFDAGYLAACLHGVGDETERLRWAAAAGSLSVRAAGGTAAQAGLDELRRELQLG
jgi:ribokinase